MKLRYVSIFLVFVFLSCAVKYNFSPFLEIEKASELAKKRGLSFPNPFEISDNVKQEVEKKVHLNEPPYQRFKAVFDFLCENGKVNIDYNLHKTLTAQETYEQKKGNCMSYTGLFVAIARHLNLPVYFAYINNIVDFEEKDGSYIVSSHIAAGFNDGVKTLLVDFLREKENFQFYEKIDDLTAYCLFYNNLAVEKVSEGKYDEAQQILDFLLSLKPSLKEVLNNKGVLYLKKGEYDTAMKIFDRMRLEKMNYQPALHNGLLTAQILKNTYYEQIFEKELKEFADNDPIILYEKSIDLARKGNYNEAIDLTKRAIIQKPQSAFLYATLSVLYIKNGNLDKARDAFKRAKRMSPNLFLLDEIVKEYPQIQK